MTDYNNIYLKDYKNNIYLKYYIVYKYECKHNSLSTSNIVILL